MWFFIPKVVCRELSDDFKDIFASSYLEVLEELDEIAGYILLARSIWLSDRESSANGLLYPEDVREVHPAIVVLRRRILAPGPPYIPRFLEETFQ